MSIATVGASDWGGKEEGGEGRRKGGREGGRERGEGGRERERAVS